MISQQDNAEQRIAQVRETLTHEGIKKSNETTRLLMAQLDAAREERDQARARVEELEEALGTVVIQDAKSRGDKFNEEFRRLSGSDNPPPYVPLSDA